MKTHPFLVERQDPESVTTPEPPAERLSIIRSKHLILPWKQHISLLREHFFPPRRTVRYANAQQKFFWMQRCQKPKIIEQRDVKELLCGGQWTRSADFSLSSKIPFPVMVLDWPKHLYIILFKNVCKSLVIGCGLRLSGLPQKTSRINIPKLPGNTCRLQNPLQSQT